MDRKLTVIGSVLWIAGLAAAKLSLPLLFRLTVGADASSDRSIPAVVAAQYLTGCLDRIIAVSDSVGELLLELNEELTGY